MLPEQQHSIGWLSTSMPHCRLALGARRRELSSQGCMMFVDHMYSSAAGTSGMQRPSDRQVQQLPAESKVPRGSQQTGLRVKHAGSGDSCQATSQQQVKYSSFRTWLPWQHPGSPMQPSHQPTATETQQVTDVLSTIRLQKVSMILYRAVADSSHE